MAKNIISTKERLEKRMEAIKARLQTIKAREKSSVRKMDLRRKILVGAYYLEEATKNNNMDEIKKAMHKFLKRDSDRELFDLEHLGK